MTSLTQLKRGIDRLRSKGGASTDSLYDLKNGYLTLAGTVKSRAGTSNAKTLPSGTKGLCVYASKLKTFHHNSSTGSDATVDVVILRHPTDGTATIREIHFAEPFLGYLYVVAEYSDDSVHHFWLQASKTWTASTTYKEGDVVEPTVANGYAYKAVRLGTPLNKWVALTARSVSDVVVPTTVNGYKYTVTSVTGSNPSSGSTEPVWVAEDGAIVIEGNTSTTGTSTGSSGDTSSTGGGGTVNLPPDVVDRYDTPNKTPNPQDLF
jgi:hypothetical protein